MTQSLNHADRSGISPRLVVHVGLGKTATTTLQKHVFPSLVALSAVASYNDVAHMSHVRQMLIRHRSDHATSPLITSPSTVPHFVSDESLCGWDPSEWESMADFVSDVFGDDAHIIITVRSPDTYLRSVYQQYVHQGCIVPPSDFFLTRSAYTAAVSNKRGGPFFDVDSFDLADLERKYRTRFKNVTFVPFERIHSLFFLQEVFGISEHEVARLQRSLRDAPRENRAFSSQAMRATISRERALNRLGLRTLSSIDRANRSHSPSVSEDASRQDRQRSALVGGAISIVRPLLSPIYSWRYFIQNVFDRIVPYEGYTLPENTYLGVHREANAEWYARLLATAGG